jgi:hypothetical protein
MTWLVPKLRKRVEIREATQTPNDAGGFDRGYTTLLTVWAAFKPVTFGTFLQTAYIRGVQTQDVLTHEFIVRRVAVQNLGSEFSSAYGTGYDSIGDLNPLKGDNAYFLFLQRNSSSAKGRMFRVKRIEDNMEREEYIKLMATEIEEQGTGYQA